MAASTGDAVYPIEILLVEDSPGDVLLTKIGLEESKLHNHLTVVEDRVEAMDFLHRRGKYSDAPRPDLVLLDLNLPRKDGRQVRNEIKADPELKRIPVAVLTTSTAEQDVAAAYDQHANCYITKPLDMDQFKKIVFSIEDFWFSIVTLPPKNGSLRS